VRDLCIGCGICEYRCPVASEAAIRVYSDYPGNQS
jgi:NAD-dependent dihydropyrimidine dehydrogenase PreA subunit